MLMLCVHGPARFLLSKVWGSRAVLDDVALGIRDQVSQAVVARGEMALPKTVSTKRRRELVKTSAPETVEQWPYLIKFHVGRS